MCNQKNNETCFDISNSPLKKTIGKNRNTYTEDGKTCSTLFWIFWWVKIFKFFFEVWKNRWLILEILCNCSVNFGNQSSLKKIVLEKTNIRTKKTRIFLKDINLSWWFFFSGGEDLNLNFIWASILENLL